MPEISFKSKKAIIIGWNLSKMDFFKGLAQKSLKTPYGKVNYYQHGNCFLISRHGIKGSIPPHKINHRANIFALKKLGAKNIFSFNSTGSLKKDINPGDLVIVSDYIDFNPPTFYEKKAEFVTPSISAGLRVYLGKILKKLKIKFHPKGTYFLTKGPRLETKAEINMIKNFADVVGMTMAKEATLAKELNLEYASLSSVDNYANGIMSKELSIEDIWQGQLKIKDKFEKIIKELLVDG